VAYDSGEAVAVADLASDKRFPRFGPLAVAAGLAAVFTFPLWQDSIRLGALDLYRDCAGDLDSQDMEAAQTLADVAAAYLTNVQARADANAVSDAFRQSALHDALTGLPNRLLLSQRLEHAAQRGRRSHAAAALLFADLDRFKHVNDSYGHKVGDELLVAVARRLSALLRPGDTLARVSGD
jgi:predicted signal transduction protein with EAL and GGDEF domain